MMTWGILLVIVLGLFLTYVIWQETRSHLGWRALVSQGNVWAIRELVTAEIERWHHMRPPAGVTVGVWAGVQSAELVAIGHDHVQIVCGAEGEYRTVGGRREQVLSSLEAAMRLASKLVEMVLYDIPEVKIEHVRVDVFSTLVSVGGALEQRCILSTVASRENAADVDWDGTAARTIIERFASRFETDEQGMPREVDPGPPMINEAADAEAPPGTV